MHRLTVGSLFAGIGGFDLGLERAGMEIKWQVEIDEWCRHVLARHWPEVKRYQDVRLLHAPEPAYADVVCGGFPCQPVSVAGARRGQSDARWLWPEFARLVDELRPRYIIVENVPGLLIRGMDDVLGDLARLGYDAEWQSIPASAVGAPHLRWRVWIVAYPGRERRLQQAPGRFEQTPWRWVRDSGAHVSNAERARLERDERGELENPRIWRQDTDVARSDWWAIEPDVGRVAHGVPARVDRLRGLGNAIVPQIAEWIGRRILEAEAALTNLPTVDAVDPHAADPGTPSTREKGM